MRNKVYIALVHYPVYNKNKEIVATSVTNFDIHDISRSAKTYNIKKYYIITPVDAQIELTNKIIGFWKNDEGVSYNKDRNDAFSNTVVIESIELAVQDIKEKEKMDVKIISTSAKKNENTISFKKMSDIIKSDKQSAYLILLGTGWGLVEDIIKKSDYVLDPIRPDAKYNHLSVRSAASIILDRLFKDN